MSLTVHDAAVRQKSGEPSFSIGRAADRQDAVGKEALSRLLKLDLGEIRQQWRGLYKTQAPRHLSHKHPLAGRSAGTVVKSTDWAE